MLTDGRENEKATFSLQTGEKGRGVHERDDSCVCVLVWVHKGNKPIYRLMAAAQSFELSLLKAADICLDSKYRLSKIPCSSDARRERFEGVFT